MTPNSPQTVAASTSSEDAAARIAIDVRRWPGFRRLAVDYAHQFSAVAPFFAGDPAHPAAWQDVIAQVQAQPRARREVADALRAQQRRRGAPEAARLAVDQLEHDATVAVVTGQQAGLFGGPLFTLLKAITAIKLAEKVSREQRVPTVAIFWVEAEDHDWNEVRNATVLDENVMPKTIGLPPRDAADATPVSATCLDASISTALDELAVSLPRTEFTDQLLQQLRDSYAPGVSMSDAFARWLEQLLGSRGLIVYDASDPATKPLVAGLFAHELASGDAGRLANGTGEELVAQGYHAQVLSQGDGIALFDMQDGRRPIKKVDGLCTVGDRRYPLDELTQLLEERPQAFSPNVLLRPLVQDTLFPTICYVAGPNELAYHGQLGGIYARFGVVRPLVYPRVSATIADAATLRFLHKYQLPLETLQPQDDSTLNQLLAAQLPAHVDAAFTSASQAVDEHMERLAQAMPALDPTLEGAARSTFGKMRHDLTTLHGKMIQAAKRRDETLRRQFTRARALTFPAGHPQEREISFVSFLNTYGPALIDRLEQQLPLELGHHWVVTI